MDVAIFDSKKIRFTVGAENGLLSSKNEADVEAIIDRLEKAEHHFFQAKSLKNKDLVMRVFEIHYKQFRIIFKLHNTYMEVLYILNSTVFPPNGNPIYEAF
jgi:hypothetical protein